MKCDTILMITNSQNNSEQRGVYNEYCGHIDITNNNINVGLSSKTTPISINSHIMSVKSRKITTY